MLRDYQKAASDAAKGWVKYKKEPCVLSIPTGGGKTHIIHDLAAHFHAQGKRVCIIAHRKELLEQAASKFGDLPFQFYSAGIEKGDINAPIVIAGIQTIYDKECDPFDIIIADECHRIPNNTELGTYWQFIAKHPQANLIGLSATPYRLNGGKLGWGETIYEIGYQPLLDAGYLCPPTNKVSCTPDLDDVAISLGDYKLDEIDNIMTDKGMLCDSVEAIMKYAPARNSVLVFCVSITHCELLQKVLEANGIIAEIITGKTQEDDREEIIERFKAGEIKYLLNCEVFLEGFDAPNVDMIVCLRPTKSLGLWQQMIGRGIRIKEGKKDFLLLDMAGNLAEHGGLGRPYKEKAKRETAAAKGRICPECETWHEKANIKECGDCGYQFPEMETPKVTHNRTIDTETSTVYQVPLTTYTVKDVGYYRHVKKGSNKVSLRIEYYCDTHYGKISEWLSPHNESAWARENCRSFFLERGVKLAGDLREIEMDELVRLASYAKMPAQIVVDHSEKYPRIKKYVWEVKEPEPERSLEEIIEDEIPWQ